MDRQDERTHYTKRMVHFQDSTDESEPAELHREPPISSQRYAEESPVSRKTMGLGNRFDRSVSSEAVSPVRMMGDDIYIAANPSTPRRNGAHKTAHDSRSVIHPTSNPEDTGRLQGSTHRGHKRITEPSQASNLEQPWGSSRDKTLKRRLSDPDELQNPQKLKRHHGLSSSHAHGKPPVTTHRRDSSFHPNSRRAIDVVDLTSEASGTRRTPSTTAAHYSRTRADHHSRAEPTSRVLRSHRLEVGHIDPVSKYDTPEVEGYYTDAPSLGKSRTDGYERKARRDISGVTERPAYIQSEDETPVRDYGTLHRKGSPSLPDPEMGSRSHKHHRSLDMSPKKHKVSASQQMSLPSQRKHSQTFGALENGNMSMLSQNEQKSLTGNVADKTASQRKKGQKRPKSPPGVTPRRAQAYQLSAPFFEDDSDEQSAWPLPNSSSKKDKSERRHLSGHSPKTIFGIKDDQPFEFESIRQQSGAAASRSLRAQVEKKIEASPDADSDVEMSGMFQDESKVRHQEKGSRPSLRVLSPIPGPVHPTVSNTTQAVRTDRGQESRSDYGNSRQMYQDMAAKARQAKTEKEYAKAAAAAKPTPKPKKAQQPVEISSGEESDSTISTTSEEGSQAMSGARASSMDEDEEDDEEEENEPEPPKPSTLKKAPPKKRSTQSASANKKPATKASPNKPAKPATRSTTASMAKKPTAPLKGKANVLNNADLIKEVSGAQGKDSNSEASSAAPRRRGRPRKPPVPKAPRKKTASKSTTPNLPEESGFQAAMNLLSKPPSAKPRRPNALGRDTAPSEPMDIDNPDSASDSEAIRVQREMKQAEETLTALIKEKQQAKQREEHEKKAKEEQRQRGLQEAKDRTAALREQIAALSKDDAEFGGVGQDKFATQKEAPKKPSKQQKPPAEKKPLAKKGTFAKKRKDLTVESEDETSAHNEHVPEHTSGKATKEAPSGTVEKTTERTDKGTNESEGGTQEAPRPDARHGLPLILSPLGSPEPESNAGVQQESADHEPTEGTIIDSAEDEMDDLFKESGDPVEEVTRKPVGTSKKPEGEKSTVTPHGLPVMLQPLEFPEPEPNATMSGRPTGVVDNNGLRAAFDSSNCGPQNKDEDRISRRKEPNTSARELQQRNTERRTKALADGPLGTGKKNGKDDVPMSPPKSGRPVGSGAAGNKTNTNTVPASKPSNTTALRPTTKPRGRPPKNPAVPVTKESELAQRPNTALNDPNSNEILIIDTPLARAQGSAPRSVITEEDKDLFRWKERGLTWSEIRVLWANKTGISLGDTGMRSRYARVLKTYPELQRKNLAKSPAALAAAQMDDDDLPAEPPKLGGKTWDMNALEAYLANKAEIDDFLTSGEESEGETDDPMEGVTVHSSARQPAIQRSLEAEPLDENECWYQYQVQRKCWYKGGSEEEVEWQVCNEAYYNTLFEANYAAGQEIMGERFGFPGINVESEDYTCHRDENGMSQYFAACREGYTKVIVTRFLRTPGQARMPSSTSGWLSKRQYIIMKKDIFVQKTDIMIPLPEDPNDAGKEFDFEKLWDPPFPQIETHEVRTEHDFELVSCFTVLDEANREAGQMVLRLTTDEKSMRMDDMIRRAEAKQRIAEKVAELEESGGAFSEVVPLEEGLERLIWVEERELQGPRNI